MPTGSEIAAGAWSGLVPLVAGWLLTYAVHSTLLLGGAWIVTRRRVRSEALRDLLWRSAALAGIATATLQTLGAGGAGPRLRLAHDPATPAAAAPPVAGPASGPVIPAHAAVIRQVEPTAPAAAGANRKAPPLLTLLVMGWAAGAALLLLRFGVAWGGLLVRLRDRRPVAADARATATLERLCRATAAPSGVRLTCSPRIRTPIALGRREICVPPRALTHLAPEEQEALLAHELAHLVRRDPLWINGMAVLERVLFFQPLNRLARRSFQDAAEQLCDAWAVRWTGAPVALARCMVEVMAWQSGPARSLPVAAMVEAESSLERRVRRLLSAEPRSTARCGRAVRTLLPAALLLTGVGFAPSISVESPSPSPSPSPAPATGRAGTLLPGPPVELVRVTSSDRVQPHLLASAGAPVDESFCWSSAGLRASASCEVTVRLRGGAHFVVPASDVESLPERGLFRLRGPGGTSERIMELHAIEAREDRSAVLLLEIPPDPLDPGGLDGLPPGSPGARTGR